MSALIPDTEAAPGPAANAARSELSRRVTRDSLWLLSGYAITAGSGFLFWIVAARLIPPAQLGIDTAILSIVTAAAAMASSGIGNGLLVMLPVAGVARPALLRTAMLTVFVSAGVFGAIGALLVLTLLPLDLDPLVTVLTVSGGTVVWAAFAVQSPAITGLGQARLTLFVNGPVNLAKLALIPVFVVTIGSASQPAVFATLAPAAVATVIVTGWLLPRLARRAHPDQTTAAAPAPPAGADGTSTAGPSAVADPADTLAIADVRRRFFAYVRRDGPATGLSVGMGMSLSFIVTALAGPAQGAVFALCYQFSMILDLVSVGFATSLAMHSAGDIGGGRAVAFRTWRRVAGIVSLGVAALALCSPILFALLGSFYAENGGTPVLLMLAVACLMRTTYEIWGSLLRAEHRAATVLVFNALDAALLIPLVVCLSQVAGARGAAAAVLIVSVVLGVIGAVGTWGRPRRKVLL